MKKLLNFILVSFLLTVSVICISCDINNENEEQYEFYKLAKEAGYSDSYDNWLRTIRGEDGISIIDVYLSNNNELILVFSNDKIINLGCIKGDQGIQGEKGDQGIQGEKGEQGIQGEKGEQGIQGEKGDDGISITETIINDKGELIVILSNGKIINLGVIKGEKGEKGDNALHSNETHTVMFYLDDGELPEGYNSKVVVNWGDTISLPIPVKT